jgi:hypothetical protein
LINNDQATIEIAHCADVAPHLGRAARWRGFRGRLAKAWLFILALARAWPFSPVRHAYAQGGTKTFMFETGPRMRFPRLPLQAKAG